MIQIIILKTIKILIEFYIAITLRYIIFFFLILRDFYKNIFIQIKIL